MEIDLIDRPDSAETEELLALRHAAHAADTPDEPPPLRSQLLAEIAHPSREYQRQWLAARVDGGLVAVARLKLPQIDNRQLAEVFVEVAPGHRRRGIGRALMERAFRRSDEAERSTVVSGAIRPHPDGPARPDAGARFLERLEFSPGLTLVQRRLDLAAVDEAAEQQLAEQCQPHASEYQLHSWTGETPESFLDGVAYLGNRLVADAPAGELSVQSTLDAPRVRAEERELLRTSHLVSAVAQHRDTGLAGISQLKVRPTGDRGSVTLTVVDPRHRGHRLGILLKIAVHRLARHTFPELGYVHTGNADTNGHMAAINERLGFAAYQTGVIYQHRRPR
ncbi:GNAT family N-acetyltransferase [Natronosporangium hydrolyticum]|uniref:GNAT family N-acetyltransferase n=1 Tax=Natronosporangium hydrolyticum TaxID=2811111 RepID=A0A895YPY5_9ACTN|nr:GNAT family N-acetyltransferase [Natronosporangium hydrolyticum]QSB16180.1 GNAT family N-acetyltransferase [Natronosporangium hydrolyticum]